jgi:cell volume regulation protein A
MGVGAAVGAAVGSVLPFLLRHARFASDGLYDIAALVAAALAYGVASVAHGSGFLAVFIVGILLGAERTPRKGELERSAEALASFAEMATFTALGLTIDLTNLTAGSIWLDGLLLSVLLVAIRPAVVLPLLAPLRVGSRERFFISLAGMKGAVSILLAAAAVEAGYEPKRIYGIVFLAVLFSVISQGGTVRHLASGLLAPPREENEASRERHTVARRSRAEGVALRDLPLGPRVWIEGIDRGGQPVAPRGRSVLEPGDVVIVRSDGPRPARRVRRLLEEPRAARQT